MITIIGATGRVGGQVARHLLRAGAPVRALGRSAERLATLAAAGADVVPGDVADPGFLAHALRGADAVFAMMPFDPTAPDFRRHQSRHGEAIVQAVRASGVRRVVALSSVGADLAGGNGPVAALHAQEGRLRLVDGIDLALLRPAAFFENFEPAPAMIRGQGVLADAYAPEVPVPMVATADVARVAAEALLDRDWQGTVVRELLGPREIAYAEAARIIGARLGRPEVPYVQVGYAEWAGMLVTTGMSPSAAAALADLARAINEARVKPAAGGDPSGRMPSRFEDYVAGLAFV